MTVLIKTNRALPKLTRTSAEGKASIYDFASLADGECFLVQDVIDLKKAKSKLQSAIGAYRKRTGDKTSVFAVRSFINEDGTDGVGVWRVRRVPAKAEVVAVELPAADGAPAEGLPAADGAPAEGLIA